MLSRDKSAAANGFASLRYFDKMYHKRVLGDHAKSGMAHDHHKHQTNISRRRKVLMVSSIDRKLRDLNEIDKRNS